ncbi:MAG: cyclic nucleotide-binding domain-containing protein [Crenarchaeota archaeon]|nr:cyclic nucleotide-binding domain-containing protein [Thermoproteota archaeon]
MTKWQCIECGYFFDGVQPPQKCPGCNTNCTYVDVTCYRPECGGPANPDPLVMGTITQRIGLSAPLRPAQPPSKQAPEVVYAEKAGKESLFQGLSEKEIQQVLNIGEVRLYKPGDTVFKEGAEAVHIYIVEEGKLAIQTKEKETVYTATAGDILGWSALMAPYMRTASAVAIEKSRVVVMDQAKLQKFCEQNSSIGYKITRNTGRMIAIRLRTAKAMSVDMVWG